MARAGGNCGVWGSLVLLGLCGCSVVRTAAPNPVINLRTETQTNTSITLRWEVPDGTDPQNLTYWIQWLRDGGSNNTQNTTGTRVTVDRLAPASSYEFSVWAEKDAVSGSPQTLIATTAPNPVRNLRVEGQNTPSISLSWDPPENSSSQDLTYWAQCIGYDGQNETRHTKDTRVTVDGLDPGTSYECSVRVEKDGVYSTWETKNTTTAPNPVRNLRVEGQNTTSISLSWDPPENSSSQDLTYWAQCIGYDGQNETRHTKDTRVTVDGLDPGTSYECSVRVEKDGVYSTWETKNTTTVPAAVNITSCISTSGGYGIILTWSCPSGSYETFEVEVGRKWSSQNGSLCGKGMTVLDLEPAQSYTATVTTVSNSLKVQSAPATCRTESTAVIAGAIVGILLLFILVGLLIVFLKRRRKKQQPKEVPKDLVFRETSKEGDAK